MTKYKCGHEHDLVIIDSNEMSIGAYLDWKESVGLDGDRSLCWACYCKQFKK